MPEMITVRCPQCGKKLLFSPFDNYKKATLECPGCHYTGLVETYPEQSGAASAAQNTPRPNRQSSANSGGISSHASHTQGPSGSTNAGRPSSGAAGQSPTTGNSQRMGNGNCQGNSSGHGTIRDLDNNRSGAGASSRSSSNSSQDPANEQPSGFAIKFPWVISALALLIIILYACLQLMSTNEIV